jgi:hypothetical protein
LNTATLDSFEDTFELDHSTYTRLFQFVELLVSSYATTSIRPSNTQIVALKTVVEAYINFLLAPTTDKELERFKARLRANRHFAQTMTTFLKFMLSNSPLDQTFVYCFGESLNCSISSSLFGFRNPDRSSLSWRHGFREW